MRWIRCLALVALVMGATGCASESDATGSAAADSATTNPMATVGAGTDLPSSTVTPASATSAIGELELIEAIVDDWFIAVRRGDVDAAWQLMAGRSQRSLGSIEMLGSILTELAEGWAAWVEADNRVLTIVDRVPGDQLSLMSVRLQGTVTREGMTEDADSIMRVIQTDSGYLISPFEEFGNIARQVNPEPADLEKPPVPADSGSGRRIVYANGSQRVWLVDERERVVDTYLVSGKQGVPAPGTYAVFSKSELAYAGHDDITMRFMVRFTKSPTSDLAIGFHSIPYFGNGEPMQTEEQLGEFHSAGCVRQSLGHAAALYEWAPEGTVVIVMP